MKGRNGRNLLAYIGLVGPGLFVFLFIIAYPIVYSIWLSVTDFNPNKGGEWNFVGLAQYARMAQDPNFWHALKNNIIVVLVSVFGQIPIGFILAYILYRNMVKARYFFQSMIFLPQFLSTIVIGLLWRRLFQADGVVARFLQIVKNDPSAQFDLMLKPETVMYPIGFALIWMYTGLYMIIFLANLQKIDTGMIEAAQIDGATEFQIFRKIIVPLLAGTVLVSTVLAIAGSLRGFDLIFSITTQGLQRNNAMVLPIYVYQTAFQDFNNEQRFAFGAAISNAIVVISVVLILFSNFIGHKANAVEEY
jgi:raffinose/stachyose/melibiose transport system permease protein